MPARRGIRAKKSAPGARSRTKRTPAAKAKRAELKPAREAARATKRTVAKLAMSAVRTASAKRKPAAKRTTPTTRTAATKRTAARKRTASPARPSAAKRPAAAKRRAAPTRPRPATSKRRTTPGRPAPPAARTKRVVLHALHAGRDAIFAACRDLTRETWEAPIAAGKWNPRQIVAHLAFWDAWTISEIPVRLLDPERRLGAGEDVNAANAKAVAAAEDLDADTTLGEFLDGRAQLISAVGTVPATPGLTWTDAHSIGRLLADFPEHDLHHASQLRTAAARRAFAPQRAGASAKELLLFELQRARVGLLAAVKGLPAHRADQPWAPGKWSPREIVLHCAVRDRVRLDEFDAALAGRPVSWAGVEGAEMAARNEAHLSELRSLSWEDALRLLQTTRDALMHRLLAVPAEPAETWSERHAFGAMLHMLPPHDRNHAEQIKAARIAG